MKLSDITQEFVKRITAKATFDAVHRARLSRQGAGYILGCSSGTIDNRLNADDDNNQMLVYELLRGIRSEEFGIQFGNDILYEATGCILVRALREEICARDVLLSASEAETELLKRLLDGDCSDADCVALAPRLIPLIEKYQAIVARAATAGRRAA